MQESKTISTDLSALFEAIPGNFLILLADSPRFTVAAVSEGFLQTTFTNREQIINKGIFEIDPAFSPWSDPAASANLKKSLRYVTETKLPHQMADQGSNGSSSSRIEKPYGDVWSYSNKPVLDREGNIQFIVHTIEIQLQQEIVPKKELIQATMDSSMDMIQVFKSVRNETGEIVDFTWALNNHTSEKIYGNVIGKSLLQLQPGVIEEGIFETFKKVVETGIPNVAERHYVHEQFYGWFLQSSVKLDDGVVTTTVDITRLKEAEMELRKGREFLQSVIDSSLDIIQVFEAVRDGEKRIIDFTWKINNLKGIQQNGDVIGKSLLRQNPGVVPSGIFENMIGVVETGVPFEQEQYYSSEQFHDQWFYQAMVKQNDGIIMTTRDITVQKKAELAVIHLKDELAKKATDKYYSLFDSIDEGFCVVEVILDEERVPLDLYVLEANKVYERIMGSNSVGKRLLQLMPDIEKNWIHFCGDVALTGKPKRVEYPVKSMGKWFTCYASPIADSSMQLAVVFNDITDRKIHEQTQAYLLLLSDAVRTVTDPIAMEEKLTREAMNFFKADRCYYNEVKAGNAIIRRDAYRNDLASVAGIYRLEKYPLFKTVVDIGRTFVVNDVYTTDLVDEELKVLCIQLQIISFIDVPVMKEGKVVGMLCIVQSTPRQWTQVDVQLAEETAERTWAAVERARAEEALFKSELRFRTLTNVVPQLIWTNNENGEAIYFNQRWYDFTGLTYEQSQGAGWKAIVHPREASAAVERWRQALSTGQEFETEYRLRGADGFYYWYLGRNVPLKDEHGMIMGWFGTATAITEQKNFSEELGRQVKERTLELQRSNDNLQQFATIASHDLQEPLRKLKMFASVMQRFRDNLPDEGKELLTKIHLTSDRMSQLIQEVLRYSRLNSGVKEFRPTDLDAVLQTVLVDLELLWKESGVELNYEIPLPQIQAIPAQMNQLFYNLMTNALKFRKKGVPLVITVSWNEMTSGETRHYPDLNEKNKHIEIRVSDNGIGFDQQFSEKIFQIFQRLHSLDEFEGTGVGLALCKKIVENHRGQIFAKSEENQGAAFHILLPRTP